MAGTASAAAGGAAAAAAGAFRVTTTLRSVGSGAGGCWKMGTPFSNLAQLLGPQLCAKVGGFLCAGLCCVLFAYLFVAALPVLFANAISGVFG